jgi:hypothetical protein
MSGQYKVAWLSEALLVSRSGYYHWKERRQEFGAREPPLTLSHPGSVRSQPSDLW